MRTALSLFALALTLQAVETWQRGPLTTTVDDTGRVVLTQGKTVVLNYDQLQLVSSKPAWKVAYSLGSSRNVQVTRRDDGARVSEALPKVLSYQRDLRILENGVAWTLSWEYPADTGATACNYFVDIPAQLIDGALCEYDTGKETRMGMLPGGCGEMTGISAIRIYGKGIKLDFRLGGENVVWKMTDWSTSAHKSYRLRIEAPAAKGGKATASVELRLSPCAAAPIIAVRAQRAKRQEARRQEALKAQGIRSQQALTLGQAKASATTVKRGQRFELTVPMTATFDNPYDPDDIALDAEFTRPDGKIDRVPGYLDVPAKRDADGTFMGLGKPVWRVRYLPLATGTYRCRLTVRDRSGSKQSPPASFICAAAPFRGLVRVSKAQPYAYEYDDGTPYLPIGINVFSFARLGAPYPEERLATLRNQVQHLGEAGGTFIRLRMDSWWLAIEGRPDSALGHLGPGLYNQRVCDEIDQLMAECEQRQMQVMLCLYNANGMVNGSVRKDGPTVWRRPYAFFLKDNGGPCEDRAGFWTNPTVKKWVRMKLRYSVARWGASPSLMCWEFWNEVVYDQKVAKEMVAWHDEMGKYLRTIDPWRHPISNSIMGKDLERQGPMWELPETDIVQVHSYRGTELPVYMDHIARTSQRLWKKPFFFGEYGIIHEDRSQGRYPYDPDGVHMHNGLWAPVMAGSAPGAFWFVSGYIEKQKLYGRYTVLAKWTADMPFNDPKMRAAEVAGFRYTTPPPLADGVVTGVPANPCSKAKIDRFVVDSQTGKVSDPEWFQSMLHTREDRKTSPTLVLDCSQDAVLEVSVATSVGDETNKLLLTVDGGETLTKDFPAGKDFGKTSTHIEQYDNWRTAYGETVAIPLAPGKHEVKLAATGKDRLEIRVSLRNYFRAPSVVVTGRRTDASAWVWARHRSSTAYSMRAGKKWDEAKGVTCLLADFAPGSYEVEWTDPWSGKVTTTTVQAKDGTLPLAIPPVKRDVAAKIRKR
ncbi:MAG: DUF5060 domain-containing protein [Victivallales bacterium]|nr:DUF5060 domain-containing protein [Victivallales bacterium]